MKLELDFLDPMSNIGTIDSANIDSPTMSMFLERFRKMVLERLCDGAVDCCKSDRYLLSYKL